MQRPRDRQRPKGTSNDPWGLFDISDEMKLIIVEIAEAQAAKDYDAVETLTDELIEIIDMHEDKYEASIHVIKNSLNSAAGNQELANAFQAKATALNNVAKRLKQRILDDMKSHGLKSVNAGIFTVRTVKNSVATLTVHVPADQLPERFWKIEPDNDELRHAISTGDEVEGVTLEKGEHIRFSPKK